MMQKLLFFLGVALVLSSSLQAQYNDNQAATFNGTNSYIAVLNGPEVSPTTAITVEAWVKPTGNYVAQNTVYGKNYLTSTWFGIFTGGRLLFVPRGSNIAFFGRGASLIPANQWTHIAGTYDGTTTSLYINGVLDTSTTAITGAIGTNTDSLFIGADRIGTTVNQFFNGSMDEVRVWGVARSAAEIARDRFIPLAVIIPPATGAYAGLLCAWRMNGNLLDEAGLFQNHGQARNISYLDLRQKPVNYVDYNNTLLLDGTNGYCEARPDAQFDATDAITMEAWVRRDTTSPRNSYGIIISKGGAVGFNYGLYIRNINGAIYLSINSDNPFFFSPPLVTGTNWTHIAATYKSASGKAVIYMNGDSVAGTTFPGNPLIPSTPDSLFIGTSGDASIAQNKFKGQIDQVRIWKNVARTRDEIRANMYTGINHTTTPTPANVMVYGFDGRNTSDVFATGSVPELSFLGTARLTSAHRQINGEQTSPLLRDDAGGFGGPTYVVNRRQLSIPDNSATGVTDSVFVSASGTATTVKLFVLLNHTFTSDLTLTLTSPTGVSADVFTRRGSGNHDIMAIFDDNADSVAGLSNAGFVAPFSPLVKPNNPLAVFAGIARQGWWKLKVVDLVGTDVGIVYGWGVQTSPLVSVDELAGLPETFELLQNYPNPFNPTTTIKFTIPQEADVNVGVYNILGQLVTTLANDRMKAGSYSIQFNARGFASGTYFYRITAGNYFDTKKMLLLK